jgi:hypothetical protein
MFVILLVVMLNEYILERWSNQAFYTCAGQCTLITPQYRFFVMLPVAD